MTADLDASDGLTGFVQPEDALGAAAEFFPRTLEEDAFNRAHLDDPCAEPRGARYAIWGSGPVYDEKRDRAILLYGLIYSEPGAWNFYTVGNSIAIWTDFDAGPEHPEVESNLDDKTLLFDPAVEGELGTAPIIFEDHLYMYSCGLKDSCIIARAPLDDILVRAAWRFYDGSEWGEDVRNAVGVMEGSCNMTVHWNPFLDRFWAVYMDWGTGIVARTAQHLEGPWSRAYWGDSRSKFSNNCFADGRLIR